MTPQMQEEMVRIISENILTPVIYMIETEEIVDFICFCDRNISIEDVYKTEKIIMDKTGIKAEILDIREFSEPERVELINRAELIHSEHPIIESIFARSVIEDYKSAMEERQTVLERRKETGCVYLQ